ncbi:MAG: hypothetical protein K6A30_03135 [Lachnospiraceae bacterium]|nr:hypothetical protein [Lachnospiraceae bacterium]
MKKKLVVWLLVAAMITAPASMVNAEETTENQITEETVEDIAQSTVLPLTLEQEYQGTFTGDASFSLDVKKGHDYRITVGNYTGLKEQGVTLNGFKKSSFTMKTKETTGYTEVVASKNMTVTVDLKGEAPTEGIAYTLLVQDVTPVAKPVIKSITNPTAGKVKVTLKKKVKHATGYMIQWSSTPQFPSYDTKKVYTNNLSKTFKNGKVIFRKGQTYYIRVKAYRTFNGKKTYFTKSSTKIVRIKR